jgi:hypothetical protein
MASIQCPMVRFVLGRRIEALLQLCKKSDALSATNIIVVSAGKYASDKKVAMKTLILSNT